MLRTTQPTRPGNVTANTVGIYALMWLLGVPGLLLILLFLLGVGR